MIERGTLIRNNSTTPPEEFEIVKLSAEMTTAFVNNFVVIKLKMVDLNTGQEYNLGIEWIRCLLTDPGFEIDPPDLVEKRNATGK